MEVKAWTPQGYKNKPGVRVRVCVHLFLVCIWIVDMLSVLQRLAAGTDSRSLAAFQWCDERCIFKAARTCVFVFVCPIRGDFLFTSWRDVWKKLIAYQESTPAQPLVYAMCLYGFGLDVLVCVALQANCLSETSSGPCPLLGSSLDLRSAHFKMCANEIM